MSQSGTPDKIGKYEICGVVGKGAMGVVYRAVDPALGRAVAIKTLSVTASGNETELRIRFLREAQAAGKLQHQNIITVHELFQEDDTAYLVMELLEGASLSTILSRTEKLSLGQKLSVVDQIAAGLSEAHAHRIVHRDLKPSNIFVLGTGVVKVLDFGVAKVGDGDLTKDGAVVGTVEYMAPEQVRGEVVSRQADIFALGVLAYELFTGRNPFRSSSLASSVFKILSETPKAFGAFGASTEVPAGIEAVIMKALAKPVRERYGTLDTLREELREAARIAQVQLELPMREAAVAVSDDALDDRTFSADGSSAVAPNRESPTHGRGLYDQGVQAFNAGEHERSVETMGQVLDMDPAHSMALHYLSSSEEALRRRRADETVQKRATALVETMRSAHGEGKASVVTKAAKELLAVDPASVEARWYRRSAEAKLSKSGSSQLVPDPPPMKKAEKAKRVVVTEARARVPSSTNRWAWFATAAGLVVAAAAILWAMKETQPPPVVSAQPIDLPGVRVSPFNELDDDQTLVLRVSRPEDGPTAIATPSQPGPELRYVLPTKISAGQQTTIGLFGDGFASNASVHIDEAVGVIASVKVHDPGHIEVSLTVRDGASTIELVVDNGDGARASRSIDVSR